MPRKAVRSKRIEIPFEFSNVWAFLTVVAFPIAMLAAGSLGLTPIASFFSGIAGSLTVLVANILVENRLWMFDPKWKNRFEQPDFAFRLALISGTILLIIESAILVAFFTDTLLDRELINLVFTRQCNPPQYGFETFCSALSGTDVPGPP